MFRSKFFCFLISIIFITSIQANHNIALHEPSAKEQIKAMKNGVLLVRLESRSHGIEALKKIGKEAEAKQIEDRQKRFNLNIINAFRAKFNFMPIYFFYSDQLALIKSRQLEAIVFLSDSLIPNPSIKLNTTNFFVAEFGQFDGNSKKYESDAKYVKDENGKEIKIYGDNRTPNDDMHVLSIRDSQLIQLKKPLPLYVRTYDAFPKAKALMRIVKRLNRKLTNYYRNYSS
jgi:hypothetical protein